MKDFSQFILNIITIFSFVFYGIGIYLYVTIPLGKWDNIAVDLAIQIVGPLLGVILVIICGAFILLLTYSIQKFKIVNVFLCWFWIFSLYQCAINTFLQISMKDLSINEPINQFFKNLFPDFWYPAKEMVFFLISLVLTYFWIKRITKADFKKLDILLIALASFILVGGTVISQLFLMS